MKSIILLIIGFFIIALFIYFFFYKTNFETFSNYSNDEIIKYSNIEIDKIYNNYNQLKELYKKGLYLNNNDVITKKNEIKISFDKIEYIMPSREYKLQVNNIYNGETPNYGIIKYLNEVDDFEFNKLMSNLKNLILASNVNLNNLKKCYNDIKLFYKSGKTSTSNEVLIKKTEIDDTINSIKLSLNNNDAEIKLDNIYKDIKLYLDLIDDTRFNSLITNLENLIIDNNNDFSIILNNYNQIKQLYNNNNSVISPDVLTKKEEIKNAFLRIKQALNNDIDKTYADNIYNGNNKLGIIFYLNEINDIEFTKLINQIRVILTDINATYNINNNDVINKFNELNELYKSIYINKTFNYNDKLQEINKLNNDIYNELLLLTTQDNIYNSGVILILNTTLKRAYELNNTIEINNNINSFKEKVKQFGYVDSSVTNNKFEDDFNKYFNISIDAKTDVPIDNYDKIDTTFDIRNKSFKIIEEKKELTLESLKDDFNNIYNSFDIIYNMYKNNSDLNDAQKIQIINLNNIIYTAINNISNYYPNNYNYRDRIISIKNVIIKSILEDEIKTNNIDESKTKLFNAINEIKNLIINNYNKNNNDEININLCINNIINAINNNQYSLKLNEIKNCDKSLFNNKDIIISPKMFISANNGITWDTATSINDFKKTGINNDYYIYNYSLATSADDGKKWSLLNT